MYIDKSGLIANLRDYNKIRAYKIKHRYNQGRNQGGVPLSESFGIDFYSGYRKKIQVYTL